MSSCCACRQLEWGLCRPRSGLLTWHPSASTADSLLVHMWLMSYVCTTNKNRRRRETLDFLKPSVVYLILTR